MTFGFDKCTIINIRNGEVENQQTKYKDIEEPSQKKQKNLGIPQNQHGDHSCLKKIFTVKYRKKSHKHLKTSYLAQIIALNK